MWLWARTLTEAKRPGDEVAEDDSLCHVAVTGDDSLALCGVRIRSAAAGSTPPHRGDVVNDLCTGCNRLVCATCESLNDLDLLIPRLG